MRVPPIQMPTPKERIGPDASARVSGLPAGLGEHANRRDRVALTEGVREMSAERAPEPGPRGSPNPQALRSLKLKLVGNVLEQLTGHGITSVRDASTGDPSEVALARDRALADKPELRAAPDVYQRHPVRSGTPATRLQSEVTVRTSDHREVRVGLDIGMTDALLQSRGLDASAVAAFQAEITIDFAADASALGDGRFILDLDTDGGVDLEPVFNSRSAFGDLTREDLEGTDADLFQSLDLGPAPTAWTDLRVWEGGPAGHDRLIAVGVQGLGVVELTVPDVPLDVPSDTPEESPDQQAPASAPAAANQSTPLQPASLAE